ncbi:NAD(P)/FAD-dependent oxidoreductase [candidate division KSB1 bacterium]|nr:NAD(P)/FAD-dependent oxidoreductase [candidate division KSB1 bacterium]
MLDATVIIVGGGPAGSSCAWKLQENGIECLILDKQKFPRTKLCAGWITPEVIEDLKMDIHDYPYSLTKFNRFHIHLPHKEMTLNVRQYAIRRYEFDNWLIRRAGIKVVTHDVREIRKDGDEYVIDDRYRCHYLVGAGGTYCPVYRSFYKYSNPRPQKSLVTTLEEEFPYDYQDVDCHLWFLQHKLPGYSWYVPKTDGYLNVGIGGFLYKLKSNNDTIVKQWRLFIDELKRLSLVTDHHFHERGYNYYIQHPTDIVQNDRLFLIGDSAGLATKDMGEGIGPAIRSGILAANAIISGKSLSLRSVKKYSFPKYPTLLKLLLAYLFKVKK